ncbi:hypothetical protein OKW43_008506 [Paraburkholderia sp. WC7.3g]|uniref:hypothetical protein n=1 Tax=Paraburkholderia sp. WC7.3g TaxID=2991070 RepID=UPI003D1EACE7
MARPAAVSPETIRTAVLAMLAEAGDTAPRSDARFRKIVSVRKLRARLGAGDPPRCHGISMRSRRKSCRRD